MDMYGIPQAGIWHLIQSIAQEKLAKYGYYKVPHTPGLGVKYIHKKDAEYLLNTLKDHCKVDIDWTGRLHCGIMLDWSYKDRYTDISMPGYMKNN